MDVIELTRQLVAIKSSFEAPPYERDAGYFVEDWLKDRGFTTHRQPVPTRETNGNGENHRFNVLAEKGSGDVSLLLYGHMDTVPRVAGWSTNPWTPVEKGDRLYGLGSHDMKAGLAAIMSAAADHQPEKYKLKLAILVDEENMSRGAYQLIQSDWVDDVVLALVPESGTSANQTLGPRMITLGRRGRVSIEVDVTGISAHAADPSKGISAIERAARLITGLQEAVTQGKILTVEHPDLGRGSFSIRSIYADAQALSIPDNATFLIDRHLTVGEDADMAISQINEVIAKLHKDGSLTMDDRLPVRVSLKKRPNPYLMPYVTPRENKYVQAIENIIRDRFNIQEVVHNYGLSVADENYFGAATNLGGRNLPVIVLGTAGDNNHAADEWVSIQSIHEVGDLYTQILTRVADWIT